jgi:ABC-type ATPase with predicted acetyltransferase domain
MIDSPNKPELQLRVRFAMNEQSIQPLHFDFPIPPPCSARGRTIAKWFALTFQLKRTIHCNRIDPNQFTPLLPAPGQILLITGPSGAGKSSLLRILRKKSNDCLDLLNMRLPNRPLVDCFGDVPLEQILAILSRVGLAEAWSYLRTPTELSDGQRWRFRLAMALSKAESRRHPILIADEFCALLDRVTAAVVARSLRRAISIDGNLRAILATSHDDLLGALRPDLHVHCDFGRVRLHRLNDAAIE